MSKVSVKTTRHAVMTPLDLMLADFKEKYTAQNPSRSFTRLYDDRELGYMFAYFHEQLTEHFDSINGRARSTRHYWAESSRQMIALTDDLTHVLSALKASGIDVQFDDRYQQAVARCLPWLSTSGGSSVPDDFEPVVLVRYEPVFVRAATTTALKKASRPVNLKMEGEGSYAIVYSYIDPDYGIKFAVKRAKKGISSRDLVRFKNEFDTMKRLSFPYILDVYQYDEVRNEYRMEFCEATLRSFIARRNNNLSIASRKRIALQFLYAVSYLHSQPLLHRDISLQNVLLKVYESGAVLVKLSDFGLVKDPSSTFTRTQTEMRGTIRDPLLHDFRQYGVLNEIYAVGWVLSYIFTGREALSANGDAVSRIVQKCVAHDVANRYQTVRDLIGDVEQVSAPAVVDTTV
ncbi:protein kinase family protein [Micromonospora ureilytica]|uniref:protein kinase family protein n=1 Tax=Micromonospora ureilytica TaxID=709868 RepID=UPI002E0E9EAA|nr:protein kinase family protein [Micromonospora ureilytica]